MEVRTLTENDAAAYLTVRLRSLQEHPEAFGASYDEEQGMPLEKVAALLTSADSPTFGAFMDGALVGIATLWRYPRVKTHHRAMLTGMYVAAEVRGQGIGQALIEAVLAYARTCSGLEDVVLAVTVGNAAARHLYVTNGFTPYSVEPRYIKIADRYYDIEWMILRIV
ncbi:MAG TPA: GNAT family N-acetyltransferase [Phototrophicaceae bacterium]|nr:GNAT family N-acetyltransferase [Phototrophicaceae bacterium]